jgi:hypothetical protein
MSQSPLSNIETREAQRPSGDHLPDRPGLSAFPVETGTLAEAIAKLAPPAFEHSP